MSSLLLEDDREVGKGNSWENEFHLPGNHQSQRFPPGAIFITLFRQSKQEGTELRGGEDSWAASLTAGEEPEKVTFLPRRKVPSWCGGIGLHGGGMSQQNCLLVFYPSSTEKSEAECSRGSHGGHLRMPVTSFPSPIPLLANAFQSPPSRTLQQEQMH